MVYYSFGGVNRMTDYIDEISESLAKLTLTLMKKGVITYEESSDIQSPYVKLITLVNKAIEEKKK
jgi:hypothetical protein